VKILINLIILIIKVIINIIFFNKEDGLNVFILNNKEVEYYNLENKNEEMNNKEDPFPIYMGKQKI
jgi:hypothetical protein